MATAAAATSNIRSEVTREVVASAKGHTAKLTSLLDVHYVSMALLDR